MKVGCYTPVCLLKTVAVTTPADPAHPPPELRSAADKRSPMLRVARYAGWVLVVALVLIVFVLGMNLIATLIRSRARARKQW